MEIFDIEITKKKDKTLDLKNGAVFEYLEEWLEFEAFESEYIISNDNNTMTIYDLDDYLLLGIKHFLRDENFLKFVTIKKVK